MLIKVSEWAAELHIGFGLVGLFVVLALFLRPGVCALSNGSNLGGHGAGKKEAADCVWLYSRAI